MSRSSRTPVSSSRRTARRCTWPSRHNALKTFTTSWNGAGPANPASDPRLTFSTRSSRRGISVTSPQCRCSDSPSDNHSLFCQRWCHLGQVHSLVMDVLCDNVLNVLEKRRRRTENYKYYIQKTNRQDSNFWWISLSLLLSLSIIEEWFWLCNQEIHVYCKKENADDDQLYPSGPPFHKTTITVEYIKAIFYIRTSVLLRSSFYWVIIILFDKRQILFEIMLFLFDVNWSDLVYDLIHSSEY